jgi:hypothetical protein
MTGLLSLFADRAEERTPELLTLKNEMDVLVEESLEIRKKLALYRCEQDC